jgi:hypothetical protein
MSQVTCQACGTNLAEDAAACPECGSWRPPQYSAPGYSPPQYSAPLPVQAAAGSPSHGRHEVIQPEARPAPPAQPQVSPPHVSAPQVSAPPVRPPSAARRAPSATAAWSPRRRRSSPLLRYRRATRLVGPPIGIVMAALIAIFLLAGPTRSPGSRVSPPASSAPASTQAPATSATTAPASLSPAKRWLNGLDSLQATMNNAMGTGSSVLVTRRLLGGVASQFRGCSRGLARLGHPSAKLMRVYQQASRACADYANAAAYFAAAASAYTESGPGLGKFNRLLNRGDTDANRGSAGLVRAIADGFALQ